jgi:5-methylcytosine-specific restriction endonuclease McrA
MSVTETARLLGLSAATVCYHKRKLGFAMAAGFARRYDWTEIQRYYDAGYSARECRERFGFSKCAWTDAVKRGAVVARPRAMPMEALLVCDQPRSRINIKQRLFAEGVKQSRCEECGISAWHGQPLSLALHHRNGDGRDNRIENLAILCPNCHSQTPNFSAKNCRSVRDKQGPGSTSATGAARRSSLRPRDAHS